MATQGIQLTNQICVAPPQLREAYRLRYLSYSEKDFIATNEDGIFFDKFDALPSSITFGLYVGEQMAGTMRACVFNLDWAWDEIPARAKYPKEFQNWVVQNPVVVEWSRFAIHPQFREMVLKVELALLGSVPFLASFLPKPSFVCAVREEHMSFYQRFGYEQVSEFIKDSKLSFSSALMAMRWSEHSERIKNHRVFSRCYQHLPDLTRLDPREAAQFQARFLAKTTNQ